METLGNSARDDDLAVNPQIQRPMIKLLVEHLCGAGLRNRENENNEVKKDA